MRKLVLFMHVSLDGYASDSNGGLDWIPYNEELEKYAEEVVAEVGAPVYGRTTYRMMESYWPTVLDNPNASRHGMEHAKWVQDVKKIVEQIKEDGRHEHINHREVYRPWGVYDSIDNGHRYQVKRITVQPGAKLSVQMHHHRAEHWIVVSGTAKVTNGDQTYLVTENQSTYIPIGQVHALENPGVIPLELIEVQSGSYLGEDDIVRFEDKYGRA